MRKYKHLFEENKEEEWEKEVNELKAYLVKMIVDGHRKYER